MKYLVEYTVGFYVYYDEDPVPVERTRKFVLKSNQHSKEIIKRLHRHIANLSEAILKGVTIVPKK